MNKINAQKKMSKEKTEAQFERSLKWIVQWNFGLESLGPVWTSWIFWSR